MNEKTSRMLYNLVLPVAVGAGYAASLFHGKLRDAAGGRRGWRRRWANAGARAVGRPVWFHVSSVGEFEQAKPVITSLGRSHPTVPVVVSFASPSGYRFALRKETLDDSNNIKYIDYLPADFARNARFCLEAVDPRLLVFVKFDLWPNLIWEARGRRVPVVLMDGTLSLSSRRISGVGRSFYRSVYSNIDKILAISDSDAERFRGTVPDHPSIGVTGDTRFDRVMERKRAGGEIGFDIAREDRRVVICGSTWPQDETHVLAALTGMMKATPDLFAIVAPHEPHPDRVAELEGWARASGLSVGRASAGVREPPPRVLLIDTVGILAETYRMGDVAYIGGSFSTGVHSVIEPAIEGLPVLFGPVHDNSFEAKRLLEVGAAFVVETGAGIRERLEGLLTDVAERRKAGEAARHYVESQLGATEKCVAAIDEYL
jgi:3-deoxy-D-manno-octulosonic-acid transferase